MGGWIVSRSPLNISCHTNNELSKSNRKLFHYVCANVYRLAHSGGPSPVLAALQPRPRQRPQQPTYRLFHSGGLLHRPTASSTATIQWPPLALAAPPPQPCLQLRLPAATSSTASSPSHGLVHWCPALQSHPASSAAAAFAVARQPLASRASATTTATAPARRGDPRSFALARGGSALPASLDDRAVTRLLLRLVPRRGNLSPPPWMTVSRRGGHSQALSPPRCPRRGQPFLTFLDGGVEARLSRPCTPSSTPVPCGQPLPASVGGGVESRGRPPS